MKKLSFFAVLFLLSVITGQGQAHIVSAISGNWSATSTWTGGTVPGINNVAEIAAGHVVTIDISNDTTRVAGIEVSGTINFTASSYPLEVYGDLIINAGAVFNAYKTAANYSKLVTIHGNLLNNGSFNAPYGIQSSSAPATSGGIIMGTATTPTSISGSGAFSVIRRLIIDNVNGVTLNSPLSISDILYLKNGVFNNGTNLTVDNTIVGSAAAGAATSSPNCRIYRYQSSGLNAAFSISAGAGYFAGYMQNTTGANPNQPITESFELPGRTLAGIVISHPPGVTFTDDLTLTSATLPLTLTAGIATVANNKTIICNNPAYPGLNGTATSFVDGGLALTKGTTQGPLAYPIGSETMNRRVLVAGIKAASGNVTVRFSIVKPGGGTNDNPGYDVSERRWYGTVLSGVLGSYSGIGILSNTDDNAGTTPQLARSATATGGYINLGNGPNAASVVYSPSYTPPPLPPVSLPPNFTETDWKAVGWGPYYDYWRGSGVKTDGADIANASIKWARVFLRSDSSQASLDSTISNCNQAGVKILAVYKKSYPRNDLGDAMQQMQDTALLRSIVNRYKGSVHFWEIHNEPNLDGTYWNLGDNVGMGSTDPSTPYNMGVHRYVQWLQLAYNTIKSEDPTATVIMAGLSSYTIEPYMDRLTVEQAYNYCDEVAFHPYADNPAQVIGRLVTFKNKMAGWPAGKNNLPVWITEIGFHVNATSNGSTPVPDEATKAIYLKDVYARLMQNLPVKRPIFWYVLHEQNPGSNLFNLINRPSANAGPTTYYAAYDTIKSMNKNWSFYQGQGTAVIQEFEYLDAYDSSGDATSIPYEPATFSNTKAKLYASNAVGDSIGFLIPNILPGTYNVTLGSKRTTNRGTCQLYVYPEGNFAAGADLGSPIDMYNSTNNYDPLNLGTLTVTNGGNQVFRFKVTGKNAASSGYSMLFDYIKLTPQ